MKKCRIEAEADAQHKTVAEEDSYQAKDRISSVGTGFSRQSRDISTI